MKKLSFLLVIPAVLLLTSVTYGANNQTGAQVTGQNQQVKTSPSPTGNQVQNQVTTQNQGEDSQLQVNTQEQESSGEGGGLQTRSQTAIQNMSMVAEQVQMLLQIRTTGGIGEQVRQIAKEQDRAQTQIQEQINKLESKGVLARLLTGTDLGAVKNLKAQLVQNQARIQQLEQLQNQLSNQGDITTIQETIQALIQQNTALQEMVTAEEQTKSLFGWLIRLFSN